MTPAAIEQARKSGDLQGAMAMIRAASVKLGGLDPWLGHQYALTLMAAEQYGPASEMLALLAAKVPGNAQLRYQLGQCAELVGEYVTAKHHYRQAAQLAAKDDSQPDACRAWFSLGACLYRLGRDYEAEQAWRQGLAQRCDSIDARFQRSEVMRALGEYTVDAWSDYEARLEMYGVKQSLKARGVDLSKVPPAWDGRSQGRVMVLGTQGAGDVIQFSRYLPHVEKRSGFTPYLIAGEPLQRFLGYDIPYGCDWSVYLDSLPLVLGMPEPIPPTPQVNNLCASIVRGVLKPLRGRVGVCWYGSATHRNDKDRSSPIDFREAFASDGYELVSLQAGQGFTPKDYQETADLIATLDAVVTVDTSVVHVAGTLGVPTVLIPPSCPEYRWGTKGDRTPWYPSVRIVRRKGWDDWPGAIERAKKVLAELP